MNINPSGPQNVRPDAGPIGPARSRPAAASAARDAYRPATGAAAGGPELSPQAQAFLKIRRDLEALPSAGRAARIEELRAQVADGRYAVDGKTVAAAMLRDGATASALGFPVQP